MSRKKTEMTTPIITPRPTQDLLEKYAENLNDPDTVQEVNLHLHHSTYCNTEEENKKVLNKIYDFLAEKHNNNEAEMYYYLHKNFDPVLVQKMLDSKFPGITDGLKNCVETVVHRPIFTELSDLITSSESAKRILQDILTLVKIEVKFIDVMKDLCLTIFMLGLIGGPRAIIDLPTNFGSAIVGVMLEFII